MKLRGYFAGINDSVKVEYFGKDQVKCLFESHVPLQSLQSGGNCLILVRDFLMTGFLILVKYGVR